MARVAQAGEMNPELYIHQAAIKHEVYQNIRAGNRRIMVKAATGIGKTVIAASIIHDAISKGVKCVFTVPTLTLIDQTLIEFTKFGLDCGVIQADHHCTDYGKMVQIASIQTIASQLTRNNKAEMFQMEQYYKEVLVIQDEAHNKFKAAEWLSQCTRKPVIGLSATPWAKGLGKLNDAIVNGPSAAWLIENDYLSKYKAYSHYVPDMKGVAVGANGDYSSKQSGEKYEPKIIGDIVRTWEKYANNAQTILFTPRVLDAERFANEFTASGHSAVAVSGYMDSEDCKKEVERFKNHEIKIICSVSKLTTGFDVKDVACIVDAQPTRSLMRHIQKLGRGLRPYPGKELIILDSAGNLLRNGLPDGDFPEALDMGDSVAKDRREAADPLPKVCSKCGFVKPPKVHICPSCQFAPEKVSTLEVEAGELVQIKSAMAKRNKQDDYGVKRQFIAELTRYAHEKGFKPGFIYPKFKERYGVLPFDKRLKNVPMADTISVETQKWLTSRNIAYANRLGAA